MGCGGGVGWEYLRRGVLGPASRDGRHCQSETRAGVWLRCGGGVGWEYLRRGVLGPASRDRRHCQSETRAGVWLCCGGGVGWEYLRRGVLGPASLGPAMRGRTTPGQIFLRKIWRWRELNPPTMDFPRGRKWQEFAKMAKLPMGFVGKLSEDGGRSSNAPRIPQGKVTFPRRADHCLR